MKSEDRFVGTLGCALGHDTGIRTGGIIPLIGGCRETRQQSIVGKFSYSQVAVGCGGFWVSAIGRPGR